MIQSDPIGLKSDQRDRTGGGGGGSIRDLFPGFNTNQRSLKRNSKTSVLLIRS